MAIYSIYTQSRDDAEARNWLAFFRRHGHRQITNVMIERVYWLEGRVDRESFFRCLLIPFKTASAQSFLDPAAGPVIEIAYRPAVTDPETPSILAAARALGEGGLEFARLSKRYQFSGVSESEAKSIAGRFLFNKVVERIRQPGDLPLTLRPTGDPDAVEIISLVGGRARVSSKLSAAKPGMRPCRKCR